MRVILDANVVVAAFLSAAGAPARLLERCAGGDFELVLSPLLLAEVERALGYARIAKRVDEASRSAFLTMLAELGEVVPDRPRGALRSRDPGDDYLLALAHGERAVLVSGDDDLLALAPRLPVLLPRQFLEQL